MFRFAAGCLAGFLAVAWPAAAHPPAQLSVQAEKIVAEEVMAFRKAIAAAIAAKDGAKLRKMYNDGFVHTDEAGKLVDKKARIASALAGEPLLESAKADDVAIRVPGGWTAVATGVSPLRSVADGKTYALRWTAVYVRAEDGFQIAGSHASRLHEIK